MLLSHADRSRFTRDDAAALATVGPVHGTALVDGWSRATWAIDADDATAVDDDGRHLPLAPGPATSSRPRPTGPLRFLEPGRRRTSASHRQADPVG